MRRLTVGRGQPRLVCQQLISVGLLIGGFYLFNEGDMTMGAIIAIVMLAGRAMAPIGQFAFLITRARQAMTTLDSLQKMMEATDERQVAARSIVPEIRAGHIELEQRQLPLSGSERRQPVSGINLKIEPGERIGDHRPRRLGQVDPRPPAVRPLRADRRRDADRRARQPPIPPAPDARQLPLRRPGRRAVQRHACATI